MFKPIGRLRSVSTAFHCHIHFFSALFIQGTITADLEEPDSKFTGVQNNGEQWPSRLQLL